MDYLYIDTAQQLHDFYEQNKAVRWIAFDTEFIGEKRYRPTLCLIQAITEHNVYVIDPIAIEDITPFLQIIENEAIIKVTHAGDNDYRVLHNLYGTLPKNLFDTQLAAGFLHGIHPMSFQKLAEKELKVRISKAFTVTDWETRPISPKQLKYAFNDVIYLPDLWKILNEKLENQGRLAWFKEELSKLEQAEYYELDPMKEALASNVTANLAPREQVFLIRLFAWRRGEAERKNLSKEMILPTKTMIMIVKNINEGKMALQQNRVISDKTLNNHWTTFNDLFQAKITEEEKNWMSRVVKTEEETPEQVLSKEFLHLLIRNACIKKDVAHSLVLSKSSLRESPDNEDVMSNLLNKGWRSELLGENLIQWIREKSLVDFDVFEAHCVVKKIEEEVVISYI